MNITKDDIIKNISKSTSISSVQARDVFRSFISTISSISKSKIVKINNFGSFYTLSSPERIGRNPKTKESYIIPKRNKITLKVSNKVKKEINWKIL